MGESFTEKQLSRTVLTGATLGEEVAKVEDFDENALQYLSYRYRWRALSHRADLRKSNLSNATLHKVSLIEASLQHSDLTDTILDEGSLSGADLRDAKGITRRFLEFVSPPIPKRTLSSRESEINRISRFLLSEDVPPVMVITGESGAGKTTLLSYIARGASRAPFNRDVLWYTGNRSKVSLFGKKDVYVEFEYDYGNFYRQIATFLVVVGHQDVAELLFNKLTAVQDEYKINQVLTDAETRSILLPVFEKESWLLCFDDIDFTDFERLFDFLSRRALKTRVIASAWMTTPKSLKDIEVLSLAPLRST